MTTTKKSVGDWRRHLKRAVDVVVSLAGLLILSPLLAIVVLLIRFRMGAPVIYSQTRPGLRAKPFKMYKFRTMTDDCDSDGVLLSDEQRLTALGRVLRATSIDELPELLNVIRGEMSLVGPRPLLMDYLAHYTAEEARRHDVKPGITGWAQVNGRNALSWEEKFTLDVWYVDHWSLALDLRIILLTVWSVLRRDGISAASHATMPKFERPA